jgi:hypothetical protein
MVQQVRMSVCKQRQQNDLRLFIARLNEEGPVAVSFWSASKLLEMPLVAFD